MLSWSHPAGLARPAGLAAAIALGCAGGGVVVAACGSSESSAGFSGPYDSGSGDAGHPFDAPTGDTSLFSDSGGDAGDAEAGAPTTALFVQASPSLPDVRLCFSPVLPGIPFPSTGAMPGSNYPGIPLGGVVGMDDASPLAGGFSLYAIDAENLARIEQGQSQPYSCSQLICGPGNQPVPCLRYNLDYWPVPTTSAPTLKANADNVVALAGCLPAALDPAASAATCGASWTALGGNLHVDVRQLQGTTGVGRSMAVQVAQLSPALSALLGDAGAAVVSFGAQGSPDASVVATLANEGDLSQPAVVSLGMDMATYGQLGFAVDVPGYDGGAGHLWMSLAQAQQLVDPTQDPSAFFLQPRPYVVAVLGDPAAPHAFTPGGDAGYDGKGLHVVVSAAPTPPQPDQ